MIEINNILDVEKHINDIEVVIFDLDDTLYLEKDYVRSGFEVVGKSFPQIDNFSKKLWEAFLKKEKAIDYVLNCENALSLKDDCLSIYRNHQPHISLLAGVPSMIKNISKTKHVGVITDGRPEGQRLKIQALGLDKLAEKIIITDELGGIEYRKPNKKAFEIMKEFFNVDFKKMCYVGDNLSKDGIAPEALGMKFIYFHNADGLYSK